MREGEKWGTGKLRTSNSVHHTPCKTQSEDSPVWVPGPHPWDCTQCPPDSCRNRRALHYCRKPDTGQLDMWYTTTFIFIFNIYLFDPPVSTIIYICIHMLWCFLEFLFILSSWDHFQTYSIHICTVISHLSSTTVCPLLLVSSTMIFSSSGNNMWTSFLLEPD